MRAIGLAVAALLLTACSEPSAQTPSPPAQTPSPTSVSSCRLPVWWAVGGDVHAGRLNMSDGEFSDEGILPILGGRHRGGPYGATYDSASRQWLRVRREMLSPDASRYAWWFDDTSASEVHVSEVATGADRVVYSGAPVFIPIAFESDSIYLVHGVNLKQSAYERLYRLDPAGGAPTLVSGSDRHMYQFGWVLISDGAAWGIDFRVEGSAYVYSVLKLDLKTSQVTQWFEGPPDDQVWPLGTDSLHRLYIGDTQKQLWRIGQPGQVERLANPGPVYPSQAFGATSGFVSDSRGAWIAGQGGVWLYSDAALPRQFIVGPSQDTVLPAGPCV